jgi:hypothetical protein
VTENRLVQIPFRRISSGVKIKYLFQEDEEEGGIHVSGKHILIALWVI